MLPTASHHQNSFGNYRYRSDRNNLGPVTQLQEEATAAGYTAQQQYPPQQPQQLQQQQPSFQTHVPPTGIRIAYCPPPLPHASVLARPSQQSKKLVSAPTTSSSNTNNTNSDDVNSLNADNGSNADDGEIADASRVTAKGGAASSASPHNGEQVGLSEEVVGSQQQRHILAERFKTKLCRNQTSCPYESRCMFAHGEHELRTAAMNIHDGLFTEEAIKAFKRAQKIAAREERERKEAEQLQQQRAFQLQRQQQQQSRMAPMMRPKQAMAAPPPSYNASVVPELFVESYIPAVDHSPTRGDCYVSSCSCEAQQQTHQQPVYRHNPYSAAATMTCPPAITATKTVVPKKVAPLSIEEEKIALRTAHAMP